MLETNTTARPGDSKGFRQMFAPGRLTLGVFFPIEAFQRDEPTMRDQERLAKRAEELGFAALWVRDVPLRDPSFGDIGQVYDPWVYLGWIAAQTRDIALATGSIILPLRHPLHTAKAAASVDQLSGGRLVLGVASGDRAVEFPAFGVDMDKRGALFRENFAVLRTVLTQNFPRIQSSYGVMQGTTDLVPKPVGALPILITGTSRQTLEWIAGHADGWITYPRSLAQQAEHAAHWHATVTAMRPGVFTPFVQSLYIDLTAEPDHPAQPIHLGFRGGRNVLFQFLDALRQADVNHVILNVKYGARDAAEVIDEIGRNVLPRLNAAP
ncbi:LLM class oxidoreductase [Azospirillum brasilense]|uniref:LLM class oxidoreductase n=1 Tax=Azospirillum brasilense TaxID=192 RepID=UPI000E67F2D0|nr:LLM class oxidoreductase [Azospirillum brasilense]NUB25219.1 TIGR03571 family LLM class oxidoreductase [Azospirillum brasilense]NUB32899.1 TIGR03571 family LLM class oxidoreductase [Azospirillum brasilense]RIW02310.1 LLM class oxidoreductase [Azospirillum brasilense]